MERENIEKLEREADEASKIGQECLTGSAACALGSGVLGTLFQWPLWNDVKNITGAMYNLFSYEKITNIDDTFPYYAAGIGTLAALSFALFIAGAYNDAKAINLNRAIDANKNSDR